MSQGHAMNNLPLLLLLVGCGCATMNPSVTGSAAPGSVRRDVGHMLAYMDANKLPDCKQRCHIIASSLPSDKPDTSVERWAAIRCGTTNYYIMTWTPNVTKGGHDFSVKAEL
jgi:hypothetical protein